MAEPGLRSQIFGRPSALRARSIVNARANIVETHGPTFVNARADLVENPRGDMVNARADIVQMRVPRL